MAEQITEQIIQKTTTRNHLYRDNYKLLLGLISFLVGLSFVLSLILVYFSTHRPEPVYYASQTDGKVSRLQSLNAPIISRSTLLTWATQAAVATYNFDFAHINENFTQISNQYFTPKAWKAFANELKRSGILDTVISKKLIVHAVPIGTPVILDQGALGGRYIWKVKLPILVTYESANTDISQRLYVTIVITRVPVLNEHSKGVAIAEFSTQQTSRI